MIGLLQRVNSAHVEVDGQTIATIERGLLVLIAVEPDDGNAQAQRLLDRLLGYRVFSDANDKMNLSVTDVEGGLLLVPQFTLAADTDKGMRPSFSSAAKPEHGKMLFEGLCASAQQRYEYVETGRFGADMKVHLVNDGPVTFWLQASA